MAVKISSLRADLKRENDGDWIDIPEWPGVRFKVRGFNYGPYLAAKSIIDQRNQRKYFSANLPLPPDVAYQTNARLYLDHILLDWEGLIGDDGQPVPIERAEEYLMNPAFRDFHDHIRYAGNKIGETEAEFVKDAAKNSSRSFDGSLAVAAK